MPKTKEVTTDDVKEKGAFQFNGFVADPTLIRIMVLKEKFLEQMPKPLKVDNKPEFLGIGKFRVIGIARGYAVILREEGTGHLMWVHRMDYSTYLCESVYAGLDYKEQREKAHADLDAYPQLFID